MLSCLISWLYFARRSDLHGAPVFIWKTRERKSSSLSSRSNLMIWLTWTINTVCTCPVQSPTTRSAMKVSSVSPERWLTITPHPLAWASLHLRDTQFTTRRLGAGNAGTKLRFMEHDLQIDSRLDGLCDRADLVDLQEQTVACAVFRSLLYPPWVCHSQVVAHNLDPHGARHVSPSGPVVLIKWVLNGHHLRLR